MKAARLEQKPRQQGIEITDENKWFVAAAVAQAAAFADVFPRANDEKHANCASLPSLRKDTFERDLQVAQQLSMSSWTKLILARKPRRKKPVVFASPLSAKRSLSRASRRGRPEEESERKVEEPAPPSGLDKSGKERVLEFKARRRLFCPTRRMRNSCGEEDVGFKGYGLSDRHIGVLDSLQRSVDISRNNLSARAVETFLKSLPPNLEHLDCGGNARVGGGVARGLSHLGQDNGNLALKRLSMSDVGMTSSVCVRITDALFHSRLVFLDLSKNNIGLLGCVALASLLGGNAAQPSTSLRHLLLAWNNITSEAAARLLAPLIDYRLVKAGSGDSTFMSPPRLVTLDLSYNNCFGSREERLAAFDHAAVDIDQAEEEQQDVNSLRPRAQSLAVDSLLQVLRTNTTLRHLGLSSNNISPATVEIIANGLRHNQSIVGLHLEDSHCIVDGQGFLRTRDKNDDKVMDPAGLTVRRNKTCWVCQGWKTRDFKVRVPFFVNSVQLNIDFDDWEPTLLRRSFREEESSLFHEWYVSRALPPQGNNKYFFSLQAGQESASYRVATDYVEAHDEGYLNLPRISEDDGEMTRRINIVDSVLGALKAEKLDVRGDVWMRLNRDALKDVHSSTLSKNIVKRPASNDEALSSQQRGVNCGQLKAQEAWSKRQPTGKALRIVPPIASSSGKRDKSGSCYSAILSETVLSSTTRFFGAQPRPRDAFIQHINSGSCFSVESSCFAGRACEDGSHLDTDRRLQKCFEKDWAQVNAKLGKGIAARLKRAALSKVRKSMSIAFRPLRAIFQVYAVRALSKLSRSTFSQVFKDARLVFVADESGETPLDHIFKETTLDSKYMERYEFLEAVLHVAIFAKHKLRVKTLSDAVDALVSIHLKRLFDGNLVEEPDDLRTQSLYTLKTDAFLQQYIPELKTSFVDLVGPELTRMNMQSWTDIFEEKDGKYGNIFVVSKLTVAEVTQENEGLAFHDFVEALWRVAMVRDSKQPWSSFEKVMSRVRSRAFCVRCDAEGSLPRSDDNLANPPQIFLRAVEAATRATLDYVK